MAGSISSRIDDRTAATVAPDEPGAVSDRAAPTEDAIEPSGIATSDVTTSGVETSGPAILIEIDPGVSGGFVHNRFDIVLRGRVMSRAPLADIKLQVDDRIIATASYGQPDRAATCIMPDGTPGRQRGFQFNLPRLYDGDATHCNFRIVGRAVDGFECTDDFTIKLDAADPDPVSVIAGPTGPMMGLHGLRPHAVLYIERGAIDGDGNLIAQGWAIALGKIRAVQIFAGDRRVCEAELDSERDDVAMAHPGYPNARLSGFSVTIPLAKDDRQAASIGAQVICSNGFIQQETIPVERVRRHPVSRAASTPNGFSLLNQQPDYQLKADFHISRDPMIGFELPAPDAEPSAIVAGSAQTDPSSEIRMFCDEAELSSDGHLFVNGWAVCAAGVAQVRVLLNGKDLGLAVFGYDRADVGTIYASVPSASISGFKFERSLDETFEGEHIIRVIVRNTRNEEKEDTLPIVAVAAIESPPPIIPETEQPDADHSAEFRFELDAPALVNGAVIEPITGRLTIDGWLLSRSGIAGFDVFLDDQRLGEAHYGLARQDVGAAFPEWPNALRSGFAFHCPPRSLRNGDHTITLKLRANNGQQLVRTFAVTVNKSDDQQDQLGIRRRVARAEQDLMHSLLAELNYHPVYRFVLRLGAGFDPGRVRATLAGLRLLAFADWSVLVLADDAGTVAAMRVIIGTDVPHLADQFSVLTPDDTDAWNAPLTTGTDADSVLHALLLPGDELGADALLELAVVGGMNRDADMLYGDEVRVSPVSGEKEPFFKPDFSPDLLLSTNYLGRPWVVTGGLLAKTGATPADLVANGEYDLALRCAELAGRVHHLPKILCQRGNVALDDAAGEQAALRRMLLRRGIAATILPSAVAGTWRLQRSLPAPARVSIIIPTCAAHGYIKRCIETLRAKTAYANYEIICIDNVPADAATWKTWLRENADKVVDIPDAFNWSIFNNRAAAVADGEYLLFLNDDMEIVQADWLDTMMEHAQRPEVGLTGPQLLYPDGKVQHAGMFLASQGIGRHAFRFSAGDDPGYFGLALTQRNVIAVTGACMLVRKTLFDSLGGFETAHQIVNNDLDFCLRVHRAGLLTVFTPYATLLHYELASRATMKDVFDLTHFNAAWKTLFAAGDPYFNPRLSRHADDYRPDDEPVQWVTPGAPLFHAREIERILVIKLDHIGDFITALAPIRRLKEIFAHATITVLAGRASRAFASVEAGIDEFIPFDFFHARSQLGERQLQKDDFIALGEQLRSHRFDLAVDLRKHVSTRDVLKHTGARYLAGFDYLGQFPYLDISLDWDGDRTLQRKRSHIIDDLFALVNAIGHATKTDRVVMQPKPAPMPLSDLPPNVQALFVKPVVAVHPGAGNVTKQWPTEHFSALIDLLIERDDVNVLLVGGPDEVEVADTLLQTVLHPEAIASMAGQTSLANLPRMLLNCALYIGNDSGPKHIAAAIGMPTIGVHSGVVDPVEWGPLGPRAVALRRNMTCSPCYLAKAEDCPRALACLRFLEPDLVYQAAITLLKPTAPAGSRSVAPARPVVPTRARKGKSRRRQSAPLPA